MVVLQQLLGMVDQITMRLLLAAVVLEEVHQRVQVVLFLEVVVVAVVAVGPLLVEHLLVMLAVLAVLMVAVVAVVLLEALQQQVLAVKVAMAALKFIHGKEQHEIRRN
jgi:hypothetical protein